MQRRPGMSSTSKETKDTSETPSEEENSENLLANRTMDSAADSFDPFGIAELSQTAKISLIHDANKKLANNASPSTGESTPAEPLRHVASTASSVALRPKMLTKLTLYEEVSSSVLPDMTSSVHVEGSIYAQVQCSDAKRNAPFQVFPITQDLQLRANPKFGEEDEDGCIVRIPKQEIGHVPVAYYSLKESVRLMPVLLERKVTVEGSLCRIAVQVRSKLTNLAKLQDMTICIAVPERVNADSVEVVRGDNGQWDRLKRTIIWKVDSLEQGQSLMVSAQAKLWSEAKEGDDVRFPILLRCSSSADRISSAEVDVKEVDEHPSRITISKVTSFRLVHRLT